MFSRNMRLKYCYSAKMENKVWAMSGGRRKCEVNHFVKVFGEDP